LTRRLQLTLLLRIVSPSFSCVLCQDPEYTNRPEQPQQASPTPQCMGSGAPCKLSPGSSVPTWAML